MTFFLKRLLCIIILIAVMELSEIENYDSSESFESIFNFVLGLRNDSGTFLNFATKVQTLFCPEQPICTDEGERNRTDVLSTLPDTMAVGTDAIRIEDMYEGVGVCCLPCSCDAKTCKEDGNCCLSKVFSDALSDKSDVDNHHLPGALNDLNGISSEFEANEATRVYSECIKATRMSYRDKDELEIASDLSIPSYFMITQCFQKNTTELTVRKCQNPSEDEIEDTLPVTSLNTGRIYWNSHCASCNNDETDIMPWNSSVTFDFDFAYFLNETDFDYGIRSVPETRDDLLQFISKTGDTFYAPHFPMEDKLCLRKNTMDTCKNQVIPWLKEACERIYSPIVIENFLGRLYPFRNILCYLCRKQYIKSSKQRRCGYEDGHVKSNAGKLTVLLNYKALGGIHADMSTGKTDSFGNRDERCRCNEIYDTYTLICRRVYCPTGEFMIGCRCVQLLKQVYGMPVLLTVKVIPRSGDLTTLARKQITKYHASLNRTLHTISKNIFIDFIGLFECKADLEEYYLSLVLVRSYPGHDTKETIKPFLDYLDNDKTLAMSFIQTTYFVKPTSRIRLWTEINASEYRYYPNLADLDSEVQSQTELFSSYDIHTAYEQRFQILSPLLYCRQIQLNDTEFEEKDGRLITLLPSRNVSSRKITISYYRRVPPSMARVCVDHYMKKTPKNMGVQIGRFSIYFYACVIFGCAAFLMLQSSF